MEPHSNLATDLDDYPELMLELIRGQLEDDESFNQDEIEAWEPDTHCNGGNRESMDDSEISVQSVLGEQPASINPIAYDELPREQKEILAEVLGVGGYTTCDPSGASGSFLEKAVYEYADEPESDGTSVYREYDGNYYKLYIGK